MNLRAKFHPDAEREMNAAAGYYSKIDERLGRQFLLEIERCVQAIARNPKSSQIIVGIYRRYLTRRFPYRIIYRDLGDSIRIIAIAHLKRRPLYWARRS